MKQKLIRLLRCKKGVTYIDMVLLIIVSVMVIVLALNVFSYFTLQNDMDYIATKTADAAALVGAVSDDIMTAEEKADGNRENISIWSTFEEACRTEGYASAKNGSTSLQETMYYTVEPGNGVEDMDGRIQLGDEIVVTVYYNTSFRGLGALSGAATMNLHSSKTTLSRVYHK